MSYLLEGGVNGKICVDLEHRIPLYFEGIDGTTVHRIEAVDVRESGVNLQAKSRR